MSIREELEALERKTLSPLAKLSENAVRDFPIEPCAVRTSYSRDRDRILHCKAFRRLKYKTQVFLAPEGDHYRTRLTHTLEVSQIARTISRALRLNEDLTEAIALGHDLGHTPFGHAGEQVLNECCPHGYNHAEQSVRVVETLENDGKGLNLTFDVRDGIACHSSHSSETNAKSLEGRVVRYADKIAYMNHDIEDAIRAGIIREKDLPWKVQYTVGRTKSERISSFVIDIIENSKDDIIMTQDKLEAYNALREFLFEAVYRNPIAKGEEGKAKEMVKTLYSYFIKHGDKLPEEYKRIAEKQDIERAVCDYISGMSDRFATNIFQSLFVPNSWNI